MAFALDARPDVRDLGILVKEGGWLGLRFVVKALRGKWTHAPVA